jgi:hypothetical protein
MNDSVKYQLERAVDALRTAIKLGASNEDAYLLRNIAETINTIEGWKRSYRYSLTKETQKDGSSKFTMGYNPDYNIALYSGMDEYCSRYYGAAGDDVTTFSK